MTQHDCAETIRRGAERIAVWRQQNQAQREAERTRVESAADRVRQRLARERPARVTLAWRTRER